MVNKRRFGIDRRSTGDRRKIYDLDYFSNGGVERRGWKERRLKGEQRRGWVRVGEWCSVFADDIESGIRR